MFSSTSNKIGIVVINSYPGSTLSTEASVRASTISFPVTAPSKAVLPDTTDNFLSLEATVTIALSIFNPIVDSISFIPFFIHSATLLLSIISPLLTPTEGTVVEAKT